MDTEVFRDLLDRHSRFTTPRDTHDVVTELGGIGLGHDAILPGCPLGQARSDVTYPCSRPGLNGSWVLVGQSIELDETARRINWLIDESLVPVSIDNSGWVKTFRDPRDDRYWELSYPDSEMQGGGSPRLRHVQGPGK
ncbi:Imm27 family immunity protein [Leifsonia sp. McL0607]|uniref:Imm27 family immunity protein n=1 Tax=Leifsonia sp. McL0607 TaxID=3415672 RepID=UPI003CF7AA34